VARWLSASIRPLRASPTTPSGRIPGLAQTRKGYLKTARGGKGRVLREDETTYLFSRLEKATFPLRRAGTRYRPGSRMRSIGWRGKTVQSWRSHGAHKSFVCESFGDQKCARAPVRKVEFREVSRKSDGNFVRI
jgi:hypothetical protein